MSAALATYHPHAFQGIAIFVLLATLGGAVVLTPIFVWTARRFARTSAAPASPCRRFSRWAVAFVLAFVLCFIAVNLTLGF